MVYVTQNAHSDRRLSYGRLALILGSAAIWVALIIGAGALF